MKKFFLLFFLILFAGCEATYNLDVDDFYKEDASIVENDSVNLGYTFSGMDMSEYANFYLIKEIPYHYDDEYVPEDYVRFDNISYYEVDDLSNDSQVGLRLKSEFKNIDGFSRSNLLWKSCKNKSINKNKDSINIDASGFKSFDEYKILDKITVNIKSKYSSIRNNADSVKNGIYTWIITRDNYLSKNISLKLKTSTVVDDVVKESQNNPMFKFFYAIVFLVFIAFVIYLLLKSRYRKSNTL